jgi:hypothetical protein
VIRRKRLLEVLHLEALIESDPLDALLNERTQINSTRLDSFKSQGG